ncbi:CAP Gly-rich domain-containing protein [Phycomyces blakesleeanus]
MSGFEQQQHRRQSVYGASRNGSPHGGSSTSSHNPNDISSELRVGTRVQVQGKAGTVRFAGTTSFQTGKWIGIELDESQGKNSGVVQGKRYFECRTNHGVFVRPSQVRIMPNQNSGSEVRYKVVDIIMPNNHIGRHRSSFTTLRGW